MSISSAAPAPPPLARGALPNEAPCPNCGDATGGNYCRSCGQARRVRHVSLRRMLVDFLDDQLILNPRLPRSVAFLLLRPGYLTREYLSGRIVHYVRPLRLYLGASVLFFLLVSLAPESWNFPEASVTADTGSASSPSAEAVTGDSAVALGSPSSAPGEVRAQGSWADQIQVNTASPALDRIIKDRVAQLGQMEPREASRRALADFLEYVPTTVFLLLPVYALLLKLLYLGSRRFYVEHFIFALHLHAFAFMIFTILFLAGRVPTAISIVAPMAAVLVPWMLLYTFLAMRRVYGQSMVITAAKAAVLGVSYLVVLSIGLAITGVITVLRM